ncbi:iron donor protein CyaY [Propionivibrio dicarboxylicus]|uniref:Iron-sulfur cluster assembly protein CyaY n=1 Tax=Propionivibrio dicarboxylicus TaxID=83767 RepID=A0A1G8LY17_9RHOO|nr:iron donor protein CyaY [Propionivibrio dicarboxylicus]SDI60589.1 CyaY protein [Propionivibrio dicarboxylicus]
MNDSEFNVLADQMLDRIEAALDRCDADIDCARSGDGVLEIEFDDGGKIVVNRHGAAQEIWVAARSGGFHFRWDGAVWRDTRDASELTAALARLVSAQSGAAVSFD